MLRKSLRRECREALLLFAAQKCVGAGLEGPEVPRIAHGGWRGLFAGRLRITQREAWGERRTLRVPIETTQKHGRQGTLAPDEGHGPFRSTTAGGKCGDEQLDIGKEPVAGPVGERQVDHEKIEGAAGLESWTVEEDTQCVGATGAIRTRCRRGLCAEWRGERQQQRERSAPAAERARHEGRVEGCGVADPTIRHRSTGLGCRQQLRSRHSPRNRNPFAFNASARIVSAFVPMPCRSARSARECATRSASDRTP